MSLQLSIHRAGTLTVSAGFTAWKFFTRVVVVVMVVVMFPSYGLSDIFYTFYASVLDRRVPMLKMGNFLGVSFRLRMFYVKLRLYNFLFLGIKSVLFLGLGFGLGMF